MRVWTLGLTARAPFTHPWYAASIGGSSIPPTNPRTFALGQPARHHAGQVARLLQPEDQRGHVALGPPPRGDDEDRLRVLRRDPLGRVLELEPVGEDQVVALGGVGPERLLLLGRGPGLDVADGQAERVADLLEALEGAGVPGGVGDGARGNQPDPHARGSVGLGARPLATLSRQHKPTTATVTAWTGGHLAVGIAIIVPVTSPYGIIAPPCRHRPPCAPDPSSPRR